MPTRRPTDTPLPSTQKRSQETTERLLDAAEDILKSDGPDAATVRAIAEKAGVSVGIVYRRFPDKDTILRAAYMRFFSRTAAANEGVLTRTDWSRFGTTSLAKLLIDGMVSAYRSNRSLLKALILYARTHEDTAFRERAESMNEQAVSALVQIFEARKKEMNHPRPAEGIRFALTSVAAVAQDRVIFHKSSDPHLNHELLRLFTNYLGLPLT
jgi:AcrR family transcriptional regulator